MLIFDDLDAGAAVILSTHFHNLSLFEEVASRLTTAGVARTDTQCRAKFKRIETAFTEALENFQGILPVKNNNNEDPHISLFFIAYGRGPASQTQGTGDMPVSFNCSS